MGWGVRFHTPKSYINSGAVWECWLDAGAARMRGLPGCVHSRSERGGTGEGEYTGRIAIGRPRTLRNEPVLGSGESGAEEVLFGDGPACVEARFEDDESGTKA